MAARNKGTQQKQIPVFNWEPGFDETPQQTLEDKIREQYNIEGDFTNIGLFRVRNSDMKEIGIRKFDTLPDIWQIQEDHGGGKYVLNIQWKNPPGTLDNEGKPKERSWTKYRFELEGEPKRWVPDKPAIQQNGTTKTDVLNEMKAYKDLFGEGTGKSDLAQVIMFMMQMSKSADEKMLKMFETLGRNNPGSDIQGKILEIVLTKALEKSTGELDMFQKVAAIIKDLGGSGDNSTMIERIIEKAAPMFLARGFQPPANTPGPGVNGTGPAMLPPGTVVSDPALIEEINRLKVRNEALEKEMYYGSLEDEDVEKFGDGYLTANHEQNFSNYFNKGLIKDIEDYNNWVKEYNNRFGDDTKVIIPLYAPDTAALNQNQNNNNMNAVVQALKNATPEQKIQQLKLNVSIFGIEKTFKWCFDNGLIENDTTENGIIDFNNWCRSAGIEEYKP